MYRIEKFTLLIAIGGTWLAVLWPVGARIKERRNNATRGVKILERVISKVQPHKGKAILWARPRYKRDQRITLEGNRDYEWKLELDPWKAPVPIPVKAGSHFVFAGRHNSYVYRVTNISEKGVDIEVGGNRGGLLSSNQNVLLAWK